MPVFKFEALNAQGQTIKDEIEARTPEEAMQMISSRKLYVTSIKEKVEKGARRRGLEAPGKRKKSLAFGGVSSKQLTTFTRQLSTLQDAGLPIVRSLKILESQTKPGALKNVLIEVTEDVEGGSTLSEAMAKHPKAFDKLYVNMVKAGEAGGVLDTILQRLADFREKAQKLKKKVIGAMIYPAVVISVAGGILFGILTYIVPKFKAMFEEMGVALPAMTEMLIKLSTFLSKQWYMVPAGLFGIFVLIKAIGATKPGRYAIDKIKLKIPIFGTIISKSVIARFTRTLGTLVASGVPILEALNIVRDTTGNAVVAKAITNVHDSIREGESIAEPLAQSKVCDEMVINMIDVGEETGDLDKMLIKVADTYDEDVDTAVASLMSMMEPVIIIVLGGCVGFIVIALFMPLIKLMSQMGAS